MAKGDRDNRRRRRRNANNFLLNKGREPDIKDPLSAGEGRKAGIEDVQRPNRRTEEIEHNSFEDMEDESALESAGLDEEGEFSDPPVHISRLPQWISDNGFAPYERDSSMRDMINERIDATEDKFAVAQARNRRMQRTAALAQGIQTIADLFILNQKGGEGAVSPNFAAKMSTEAKNRLQAEKLTFEKEMEEQYRRLFRDAELEERVDQQNVQLANQIKREQFIGEIEALNEQIQNGGTEMSNRFTPTGISKDRAITVVNGLVNRGQVERAMQLASRWELFDADGNVDIEGIISETDQQYQEGQQIDPYEEPELLERAVAPQRYERMKNELESMERRWNNMSETERQDNSAFEQQLERQRQKVEELQENEHVQRHVNRQEFAQIQIDRSRRIMQDSNADIEDPEFQQAATEMVKALQVKGMSERKAQETVFEGFVNPAIERMERQAANMRMQQRRQNGQEVASYINNFMHENSNPSRDKVDTFLTQVYEQFGIENENHREQIRTAVYERIQNSQND